MTPWAPNHAFTGFSHKSHYIRGYMMEQYDGKTWKNRMDIYEIYNITGNMWKHVEVPQRKRLLISSAGEWPAFRSEFRGRRW